MGKHKRKWVTIAHAHLVENRLGRRIARTGVPPAARVGRVRAVLILGDGGQVREVPQPIQHQILHGRPFTSARGATASTPTSASAAVVVGVARRLAKA